MSVPAFAWAFDQGKAHRLPPLARLLLVYLANRANGELEVYRSQETLAEDTGLTDRHIRTLTKILRDEGLIGVTRRGKVLLYRLNREPTEGERHRNNVPVKRPRKPEPRSGVRRSKPEHYSGNGAVKPEPRSAFDPPTPEPRSANTGTTFRSTPEPRSAKTTTETEFETDAREARGKQASKIAREKKGDASPSHDPFNDVLAEIEAGKRTSLAAVSVERVSAPVEECIANENVVALVRDDVRRALSSNYPPRAPKLSPAEQAEAVRPKPALRSVALSGEALRLARERAGIWPRAQEAAVAD